MSDGIVCEERLRREIVEYARRTWSRGWVANHDGNLSARLGEGRTSPADVGEQDVSESLIVVDGERTVSRDAPRLSEFKIHAAAYAARPDIGVVVHAHPPHATAFAVSGAELPHPFLAEAVVTLGPTIPRVPFGLPGEAALEEGLRAALQPADVVLLDQHGLLAVGGCVEQGWLRWNSWSTSRPSRSGRSPSAACGNPRSGSGRCRRRASGVQSQLGPRRRAAVPRQPAPAGPGPAVATRLGRAPDCALVSDALRRHRD